MSTQLIEVHADETTVLAQYHVTKEAAIALASKYSDVTIAGITEQS